MKAAASVEAMVSDPVGSLCLPASTVLAWCESPSLCGAVAWGCPTRADVERVLVVLDAFRAPTVARRFRVILDGRHIEAIDPDALAALFGWLDARRVELLDRVELQFGIVDPGSILGVTLSGILPIVGETHAFRVVADPRVAFRELSVEGEALHAEVERAVADARGVPDALRRLREYLRAHPVDASLPSASVALRVAERTLQRQLKEADTTFRVELAAARYTRALELLAGGNDKVTTVARRVGLSESALTKLVREKSGQTPAELRRTQRA